ncbi:MAG: PilW family protein [Gemmatimonadota bacterium]
MNPGSLELSSGSLRRGPTATAAGHRRTGGFTLLEALVSVIVAGLLGTATLTLLRGQNRFYGYTDDAVYAQQNLRAATDLLASELRMAAPTDLLAATPDSVSVRFDLVRAVVCDSTAPDEATLFVYDSVTNANLPSFRGTAFSGPYDSAFAYADGWAGNVTETGGAPRTDCVARGAPGGASSGAYRRVVGWQARFGGDVPDRGSLVRVYGRLTYRFAPSSFGSGLAIWRNNQELVSPFVSGARFQYVLNDGSVTGTVAPSAFAAVRTLRLTATARGDGANRSGVQRSISFDVPLRN